MSCAAAAPSSTKHSQFETVACRVCLDGTTRFDVEKRERRRADPPACTAPPHLNAVESAPLDAERRRLPVSGLALFVVGEAVLQLALDGVLGVPAVGRGRGVGDAGEPGRGQAVGAAYLDEAAAVTLDVGCAWKSMPAGELGRARARSAVRAGGAGRGARSGAGRGRAHRAGGAPSCRSWSCPSAAPAARPPRPAPGG